MLPLLALLLIPPTDADAQRRAPAVLIDNFETGTSKWRSNDALAVDRARSTNAAIYAVAGDAPDGGAQAALIEFTAGRNTWASVTTSVDGSTWVDNSCSGLAMWIRGDGPRRRIDLVLRAYTKDADGRAVDTSYTKTVSVSSDEWHALRVPFGAFKAKNGPALDTTALPDVKLLQFVKTGTWQPLRLTVDDIRAEVFPATTAPVASAGATLVDFDRGGSESVLQHGACLGSEYPRLLDDEIFSAKVMASLALLGRTTIRVRLSDFYDREGQLVKTSELLKILAWIRTIGGDPLLCFDQPLSRTGVSPAEGWRDFGALCAEIAKRRKDEAGAHSYEVGSEPLLSGQFRKIEDATDAYNALAAQIQHADPLAEVGGLGFASPWDDNLTYFVENARTLDFVSFHFYGAHSPIAADDDLFKVACRGEASDLPHQMSPQEVRELVAERDPAIEVWITECALNSGREASGRARDDRIQDHYGGAWLTAFSISAAPYVDRVLWFKAYGHGWGLLRDDGTPTPAFHAATLFSRFVPLGATVGKPILAGASAVMAPVTTGAGRHVLIANSAEAQAFEIQLNGTPDVSPVRLRRFDPTTTSPVADPIVATSRLKLTLRGPGIAIIEAPSEPETETQ